MAQWLNRMLDKLSDFLAPRKGLLPLMGILLIGLDFVLQFFLPGWLGGLHLLLYAGLVLALFGLMLAQAL